MPEEIQTIAALDYLMSIMLRSLEDSRPGILQSIGKIAIDDEAASYQKFGKTEQTVGTYKEIQRMLEQAKS